MRRTVLYISMSLDGCLARPDGDVSWLAGQDPCLLYTSDAADD